MTVPQTWQLMAADDLFDSILHGTVRAAAVLKGQPAEVLARIRRSVFDAMGADAGGDTYRVPVPAVVTTATKPAA